MHCYHKYYSDSLFNVYDIYFTVYDRRSLGKNWLNKEGTCKNQVGRTTRSSFCMTIELIYPEMKSSQKSDIK